MVKLNIILGRTYDGYGEQVVKKEQVVMTNVEAAMQLEQLIHMLPEEERVEFINKIKGK
jgi:hypothetical protein